jgi:hypothetical protein
VKTYIRLSGTIFALVAALHVFVTYEHWRAEPWNVWSVLLPAVVGALSAGLTLWAHRLARVA